MPSRSEGIGKDKLTDLQKKRKSIEIGHFEAWLTNGRGSFHFENLSWLRTFLTWLFKVSRLSRRGEQNALDVDLKHLVFEFDRLPRSFDGFTILFLSDLHIDCLDGLAAAVGERISDLEYDICVLGGDYRFEIYGPYHAAYHYMEELLSKISAPHGIVGILGNHDFAEAVSELERLGVTMLVNRSFEVSRNGESIWFVGLDDAHYYGCDDLPGALDGVPKDAFKTILVHSPELYKEADEEEFDLYLCGHTHAGQIRFPVIGPVMVNSKSPRFMAGGEWRFGCVRGYTSSGVGSSMVPVRFRCRPEAALIELRRSSPEGKERHRATSMRASVRDR